MNKLGHLYTVDEKTGECKLLCKCSRPDVMTIDDTIVDERPIRRIDRSFTATLTLKLPKVVDVDAREVNENGR